MVEAFGSPVGAYRNNGSETHFAVSMIGKSEGESDRTNKVFDYMMNNFKNKININEIADLVNLHPNLFKVLQPTDKKVICAICK